MPSIRDAQGKLTEWETTPPPANGSGPVERLVEPSMVRVPEVTGKTNAEFMAASRARGAKAGGFVKGATKAARQWNGGPIEEGRAHAVAEPIAAEAGGGPGSDVVVPWLPCPSCAHAAVCSIRPLLEALATTPKPESPHPAIAVEARLIVTCKHFLEAAS